jgi:CubicO group peptidase (beta-lactamase class C family)
MKAIFRTGVALTLLAMATSGIAQPVEQAQSGEIAQAGPAEAAARGEVLREAFAAAELWVDGYRRYQMIPALSVAVANGNETVWAKGFGTIDRAGRIPATADTIYSICSISKLFTAVALMQQWEKGKVTLDAPITEYLPWATFADDPRDSVPITLRGVLSHSAGLPREADFPYWSGPDFAFPTQQEIRTRLSQQAPLYPAETVWQYSNLGLTLAGETVEAVGGAPYAEYVQANILDPLALADTRPRMPHELYGKTLAVGWGARKLDGSRPEVKIFDPAGITPAAGYSSTVADLARFASWTFRLAKNGDAEVLRYSTLREMERVQFMSPDWDTSWGLGFSVNNVRGTTVVGHDGACPGYRSILRIAPQEEMAVAVAMNTMEDPGVVANAVAALLNARSGAQVFAAPAGEAFSLSDYAGVYDGQPWDSEYYLVPWAGGLTWIRPNVTTPADGMQRLKPLGGDRFRVVTGTGQERHEVVFDRDRAGKVEAIRQHSNVSRRVRSL